MQDYPIGVKFLGWISTIVAALMLASPAITAKAILDEKGIGRFSIIPFCGIWINCVWMVSYALVINNDVLMACNLIGVVVGSGCILVFYRFAPPEDLYFNSMVLLAGNGSALLLVVLPPFYFSQQTLTNFFGVLAVLGCLIMFGSPLSLIKEIISKGDASNVALVNLGFGLLSTTLWILYGAIIQDYYVGAPQIGGLLLCLVQVALVLRYHPKYHLSCFAVAAPPATNPNAAPA